MPTIIPFLIFIFAMTIVGILIIDAPRIRRERLARANSMPVPEVNAELLRSDDYWAGLAAGARFLGTYRSPDEIDTCWSGMATDLLRGDQAEKDFATGWMRSVKHMRRHLAA